MQPQAQTQADGFRPKWRNIPPQATIWLKNPFQHDVVFRVADELNRPYQYRLPAGRTSELPGGAIATLGLKHIVDELIQNTATQPGQSDLLSIWDQNVRKKYEDVVIVREKTAPAPSVDAPTGAIDLSVPDSDLGDDLPPEVPEAAPEAEFPGLATPALAPAPVATQAPIPVAAAAPAVLAPRAADPNAPVFATAAPVPANPDVAAAVGGLPEFGTTDANNAGHPEV